VEADGVEDGVVAPAEGGGNRSREAEGEEELAIAIPAHRHGPLGHSKMLGQVPGRRRSLAEGRDGSGGELAEGLAAAIATLRMG